MKEKIIRSPKLNIPFGKLRFSPGKEPEIEIMNWRTKKKEVISLSSFIALLIRESSNPSVQEDEVSTSPLLNY